MRRSLVVAAAVGLLAGSFAPTASSQAGTVRSGSDGATWSRMTPALEAAVGDLAPDEVTTVLVTLREQADLPDAPPEEVILELQDTADRSQAPLQAVLEAEADQGDVLDTTPLWVLNAISVTATADVVEDIAARSDVARVVPDEVMLVPAAAEPNQAVVGAPAMWELGHTGDGVVVGTLDSGVDFYHPDLAGRWRGGTNSWFDPYGEHPTTPTDLTGHGTGTMGAILGGDAGGSSIGAAPGATWIAAKIFDDRGAATVTAVHQAFQWLLDPDHDPGTNDAPQVVSGSWSIGTGPGCDLTFQPDLTALEAVGILPVFSAGNFGPGDASAVSPANYPEALAVGAVSNEGLIYSASSRGPSTCGGRTGVFPDLVAPGVDIRTTDRFGLYQTISGTSLAAPHVAGALAVLLEAHPGLSADQQRAALVAGAADLGSPGPDDQYGAGRLDVQAAYHALSPPPGDFVLDVTPAAVTVVSGGTASYTAEVTSLDGFADNVTLSLKGQPGDALFSPPVVAGGAGASVLEVTTTGDTSPGTYDLLVTGTSGALSRSAGASLTVVAPPPADPLEFSTAGNANPPGVAGTPDDADAYGWDGAAFSRTVDVSTAPYLLPTGANVDGVDRVDGRRFYLSFATDTRLPRLGVVQDEDVVYFDDGAWSVYFNGTAYGLTTPALDVDALSVAGSTLFFSTSGNAAPPGVRGVPDNADIYGWRVGRFARLWDATANGLASAADVDGLARLDDSGWYLSFGDNTIVPGLGTVQDEDVVRRDAGGWSVYFDGTARGLTTDALDVDAFDVP